MRRSLPALLLMSTLAVGCASDEPTPTRQVAALEQMPAPELGESWTAENDQQAAHILQVTQDMLSERSKDDSLTRRDAHPKHHGCAKAMFDVDSSSLPVELRTGIFAPGAEKEFKAWVRFSNGAQDGATKSDLPKDVRGMAIKLMNVAKTPSGSQDFVLCTAPQFFSKDAADYSALHSALTGNAAHKAWYFGTHWTNLSRIKQASVQIASSLETPYYSATPYKLGNRSMRFSVEPCEVKAEIPKEDTDPNYLKSRLVQSLSEGDRCFKFFVQPNMHPETQLVEDATLKWDEKTSPKYQVATLHLPKQTGIDSSEQLNMCENLSFDPWHSQAEIRPLGQINRVRGLVYHKISELRHRENRVTAMEPRTFNPCRGNEAALCENPHH